MSIKDLTEYQELLKQEKQLEELLGGLDKVLVAFSGGVDSSYLLAKAVQVKGSNQVMAVTVKSNLNPPGELEEAARFALKLQVQHCVLNINLTEDRDISANTSDRCYFCKRKIFVKIKDIAAANSFKIILDGSNANDLDDYRPGMQAIRELGVHSPLLEVSLGKAGIRELSRKAGLKTWNKPAEACLATRFPYGEGLDTIRLRQVFEAEKYLRQIGIKLDLRVRCHGELARIEVNASEIKKIIERREEIFERMKEIGFFYVTLDLNGFKTGSMNRMLPVDRNEGDLKT